MRTLFLLIVLVVMAAPARGAWTQLPSIPDSQGLAGAFAGVSNDVLLFAGGANFPDKKPWEGGQKVWHDTVMVLHRPEGQWKVAGKLPRALGYGICATYRNAVICAGGCDAKRHYCDVFQLECRGDEIVTTSLPPLPRPVAFGCGAIVGDTLYIAGGQETPDALEALKTVFAIDLSLKNSEWRQIESWPGPGRILSLAASFDGAFWLVGGAELAADASGKAQRRYLKDVYRYDPKNGWKQYPDLPVPLAAVPSPAASDELGFFVLGGDDGSQLAVPPDRHAGYGTAILYFDRGAGKWLHTGEMPLARVTTPLIRWNDRWIIPSGEVRPGIRSPQVWSLATADLRRGHE